MDLDLKEVVPCADCGYEGYEEDFVNGCPRCGAVPQDPDEEGDDDDDRSRGPTGPRKRGAGGRKRGGPKRTGSGGGPSPRGKGKGKGKAKAKTPQPPEKRQLVLSEDFKQRVFEALRFGEAEEAQGLCFEVAGDNEEHARQVYGYLVGVAKKKGWLGVDKGKPRPAPRPKKPDPADAGVGSELPPGLVLAGPGTGPGQPGMQQPGMMGPPGMQQPGMQQPGMMGPPGMQQPGMQQPGMMGPPGMQQPGM
ncbi:MAG: hypothetical protein JKY65_16305, partial [Planctomycetes bacterium]|nr:hypothetical protein [Planctomycetota bacterium]